MQINKTVGPDPIAQLIKNIELPVVAKPQNPPKPSVLPARQ